VLSPLVSTEGRGPERKDLLSTTCRPFAEARTLRFTSLREAPFETTEGGDRSLPPRRLDRNSQIRPGKRRAESADR
jgi:hypothetical protein